MFTIRNGQHFVQRYSIRLSSLFVFHARRPISTEFVKPITVKTCVGIYDSLRKNNPEIYGEGPNDGLELTVNYADTLQTGKHYDKVVLAVHGNPGNYTNFNSLMKFYQTDSSTTRVIAPNLPDFSHTRKTKIFWHSTEEKVTFLKDFLAQIEVKKIDCLVSHSFGVQTAAALWENPGDIEINSVAMFSPQPLWNITDKEVRKNKQLFLFKSELWYQFLSLAQCQRRPTLPFKLDHINELLMLASISLNMQTGIEFVKRLDVLLKMDIPVVMVYGTNDKIIPKKSIQQLNVQLGIKPEDIVLLDPEKYYDKQLKLKDRITSYLIEKSGHMVHEKRNQFANKIIDNLLNYAKRT